MYLIKLSKQAQKDKKLLKAAGLEGKAKALLDIIRNDPFQNPPRFEPLVGNLQGNYSRRINIHHRLVYSVRTNDDNLADSNGDIYEGIVIVKSMRSHYESL